MAEGRQRALRGLGAAALVALLGAAVWLAVRPPPPPQGPVPVPYGKVRCARCGMLVDEPPHAGQVQTPEGEVLFFDDPGCLLLHEAEPHAPRRAVYVHHHREDRWLRLEEARFVPAPGPTPMGYGLAAVSADEAPDGLTAEQALARARAHEARRRGGRP